MSDEFLTIDAVGVRFGGLRALDEVSFSVARGEILGLIGPNGSGKTTLMNVISGLVRPDSGCVRFRGTSLARVPVSQVCQLGIARTFQVVRPFANMSVLENVAVGAMFGRGGARRTSKQAFGRARDVLEFTHLAALGARPASQLTIADRKRLEVAKALALEPDLLLLDEVMAGLNSTEVDAALALLRELAERGVTIIVVEHLMRAIMAVSTRIVVLAEGKKIADGTPHEVTNDRAVISAYLGARFARRQAEVAG